MANFGGENIGLFSASGKNDVLSSLVFSLFFNGLIEALKEKGYGVKVRWKAVCGLWNADDVVLSVNSAEELTLMMECADEYCEKRRCAAKLRRSAVW